MGVFYIIIILFSAVDAHYMDCLGSYFVFRVSVIRAIPFVLVFLYRNCPLILAGFRSYLANVMHKINLKTSLLSFTIHPIASGICSL